MTDFMKDPVGDAKDQKDPVEALWVAPTIMTPEPGTTLPMTGFNIEAVGFGGLLGGWEVEIWGGNTKRHYSVPGTSLYLNLWIPGTDIPVGKFHIRVRYSFLFVWSGWQNSMDLYKPLFTPTLPAPGITLPRDLDITSPMPTVTGSCLADATSIVLHLREPVSGYTNATKTGTGWSLTFSEPLPPGPVKFEVLQYRLAGGKNETSPGHLRTIKVKPIAPRISIPTENASVSLRPRFSGTGHPGATVNVIQQGHATPVLATSTVDQYGNWAANLKPEIPNLPIGVSYEFSAQQIFENVESDWLTPPRKVRVEQYVPDAPFFVSPKSNDTVDQDLLIVGICYGFNSTDAWVRGAGPGETWEEKVDPGGSNKMWYCNPPKPYRPGVRYIQAKQRDNGVDSSWGEVRRFLVRPPTLAITDPGSQVMPNWKVEIKGVYPGAELLMQWFGDDGQYIAGSFSTSGTTSTFTPSTPWEAGQNKIVAHQFVDTVVSVPSNTCIFIVKYVAPAPHITPPTGPVESKGTLLVTKVWYSGSPGGVRPILKMLNADDVEIPGSFSGSETTRTFTPELPWTAGNNTVKVLQNVNSVPSDKSAPLTFKAKPGKPVITPPSGPVGADQALTITDVFSGMGVVLKMLDDSRQPVSGTFSVNGTTSVFTPTPNWLPGKRAVRLEQTVEGLGSVTSDRCLFGVKPSKLLITPPEGGVEPSQFLEVTGVYSAQVVTLAMLYAGGEPVEGHFSGNGTTRRFMPAPAWPAGPRTVQAVQFVEEVPSDDSELCSFFVRPLQLTVVLPAEPLESGQALSVIGVSSEPGITLKMLEGDDTPVDGEFSGGGTARMFTPQRPWKAGLNTVKAIQLLGVVPSEESDPCTFKVKPEQLLITPPQGPVETGYELSITPVDSGAEILQILDAYGAPVEGHFSGNGTVRSFTPELGWTPGEVKVTAVQFVEEVPSDKSVPCIFEVKPRRLIITPPDGLVEIGQALMVTGVYPGSANSVRLVMLDGLGVKVDGHFSGSGASRSFTPASGWKPGERTVKAMQIVHDIPSEESELCPFRVRTSPLTIVQPTEPLDAAQGLSVTGVYSELGVDVTLKMLDVDGAPVEGQFSGSGTARTFLPQRPWKPGLNTVKALQLVENVPSEESDRCTFKVKPDQPAIISPDGPVDRGYALQITHVYPGSETLEMLGYLDEIIPGYFSGSETTRNFTPDPLWSPGVIKVKVVQIVEGVRSAASDFCLFKVLPPPLTIIPPTGSLEPDQTLTVTGIFSDGVTLKLLDVTGEIVGGRFSLSGASRTFTPHPKWIPGIQTVEAVQFIDDVSSLKSDPCIFEVKPDRLAITPLPGLVDPRQVLSLTNVYFGTGVTLKMLWDDGELVQGSFSGSGTTRTFTSSLPWEVGERTVKAVQIVNSVCSDPSNARTFSVRPAEELTVLPLPGVVEVDQPLRIVGVYPGEGVRLQMLDASHWSVPGEFSGSGTTRTFVPRTGWKPGARGVKVDMQVLNIGGGTSDVCWFKVKPPHSPYILPSNKPIEPSQHLTVSSNYLQWEKVTLTLLDTDGLSVKGTFSAGGFVTDRVFTPESPWKPGKLALRTLVTVEEVDSAQSDEFVFKVKPPKAAITPLPVPVGEQQTLSITSVYEGAEVTLTVLNEYDWPVPGRFSGDGDSRIFTPDPFWEPGERTVSVVVAVEEVESDQSDAMEFIVKPPTPRIISLGEEPVASDQPLRITGLYAGSYMGMQKMLDAEGLPVQGEFNRDISMPKDTQIFVPKPGWKPGARTVQVVEVVNDVDSDPSDLCTFKVIPPSPSIMPLIGPVMPNQTLIIHSPCLESNALAVALTLREANGKLVNGDFSGSGTSRTFTPNPLWESGKWAVYAVLTMDGVDSVPGDLCTFIVAASQPDAPTITQPKHGSSTSEQRPLLEGTGAYEATVDVRLAGGAVLAEHIRVTAGLWTHQLVEPLPLGKNHLEVRQCLDGLPSDWSDEPHEINVKPEIPVIKSPMEGATVKPLTTIAGISLPYADITVKDKDDKPLFTHPADADGNWSYILKEPLGLNEQYVYVKQTLGEHESGWSDGHLLIVEPSLVPPPGITRPPKNGTSGRKPLFTGSGINGGTVILQDTANGGQEIPNASVKNRQWRSQITELWDVKDYAVRARQIHGSDDGSHWTDPAHTFSVTQSLFEFYDTVPVIGQPVAGNGESALLQVQVISTQSGEGVEGVNVEWSVDGHSVMATTSTDRDGWARYRFTPEVGGDYLVLADVTGENEGVIVTQAFEVMALQSNAWEREFTLLLDGDKVDLAKMDLFLLRDEPSLLTLIPNRGSPLIGLTHVSLEYLHGIAELGIECNPPLGTLIPLTDEYSLPRWTLKAGTRSGFFGLKLACPKLPDWQLPGQVISRNLADEVDVTLDGFPLTFGGEGYPCRGATHAFTVRARPGSPLFGENVKLEWTGTPAQDLGVVVTPALDNTYPLLPLGFECLFNCVDTGKDGRFSLVLTSPKRGLSSAPLAMSLGHHKVQITETFGPREMGGTAGYWRYGILAHSMYTGLGAPDVPVSMSVPGDGPTQGSTESAGWMYSTFYSPSPERYPSVTCEIYNRFDGSYSRKSFSENMVLPIEEAPEALDSSE